MHFLVMSLCSREFLLMSMYIYSNINIIIMVIDYYSILTYGHLVFRGLLYLTDHGSTNYGSTDHVICTSDCRDNAFNSP